MGVFDWSKGVGKRLLTTFGSLLSQKCIFWVSGRPEGSFLDKKVGLGQKVELLGYIFIKTIKICHFGGFGWSKSGFCPTGYHVPGVGQSKGVLTVQ
jgi:hypothetical protein